MNLILSKKKELYYLIEYFKIDKNTIEIRIPSNINFIKDILSDKKYIILSNNKFYFKIYDIIEVNYYNKKFFDTDNINITNKTIINLKFNKKMSIGGTNLKHIQKVYDRKSILKKIINTDESRKDN